MVHCAGTSLCNVRTFRMLKDNEIRNMHVLFFFLGVQEQSVGAGRQATACLQHTNRNPPRSHQPWKVSLSSSLHHQLPSIHDKRRHGNIAPAFINQRLCGSRGRGLLSDVRRHGGRQQTENTRGALSVTFQLSGIVTHRTSSAQENKPSQVLETT